MPVHRSSRRLLAAACFAAPLFGVIAAAADPALGGSRDTELVDISRHSDRFYVYAICILLSSYLLVPAVFAIMALVRESRPRWAVIAGGIAQAGLLVAIGDAAVELMYWQMGQPGADHQQMAALADRYESAAGSSLVYSIGGLATLAGIVFLSAGLWRARTAPRWVGPVLTLSVIANFVGFGGGSSALLIGSYVLLAAALVPVAAVLVRADETGERRVIADADKPLIPQPSTR